jgi:hypothetical protein
MVLLTADVSSFAAFLWPAANIASAAVRTPLSSCPYGTCRFLLHLYVD